MNIPKEFIDKLIDEINILPLFLLETNDFNNNDFHQFILNGDLSTLLKILKLKLFLIYNKKCDPCTIDLDKICNIPYKNLHEILFYSLLVQSTVNLKNFNESVNILVNNNDKNDINEDIFLFNLEIISVVLQVLLLTKNNLVVDTENKLYKLLINLVCNENKNIQKKVVLDVIPKYLNYTNKNELISDIWEVIQNSSLFYSTLISLEKYFIFESKFNVFNENKFWLNLQTGITNSDSYIKKQSLFLLKNCIKILFNNEKYKNFSSKVEYFNWDLKNSEKYQNSWKNFFILCDASTEKQLHLIEPTFGLYTSLKNLHFSWECCVSKLFIFHPHSTIVKYTINQILKSEWICEFNVLIEGLNNVFLYSDSVDLQKFVLNLNQNDFLMFCHEICKTNLNPVAFYYICQALQKTELNLKFIIDLINKNQKIPHIYIRKGIYHSIFISFQNTIKINKITEQSKDDFVKILYLLYKNDYLYRNNWAWKSLIEIIVENKNSFDNFIINKFILYPKEYQILFTLLIDSNLLQFSWIKQFLNHFITTNDKNLQNLSFIFELINCMKIEDQILEPSIIYHHLFIICNNQDKYSLEFFQEIEFILDVILLNKNCIDYYENFLDNFKKTNNDVCYIIFSKKVLEAFDLNKKSVELVEKVNKISRNLKVIKKNCTADNNNIKNKLFSNYYHSKLIINKIFIKINHYNQNILNKLNKYYDKSGLDLIILLLETLDIIITNCQINITKNFVIDFRFILNRCQNDILNIQSHDLFKKAIKKFISITTNPKIFQNDVWKEFSNDFFAKMFDSSQIITGVCNEILNQIVIEDLSTNILVEALLFGNILRKDQRIEFEVCNSVYQEINEINFDLSNPYQLNQQVRSKAVSILLQILYKQSSNSNFSETILNLLIKKYDETKNKRYFNNSQIHFTKLRIMQSLHLIILKLTTNQLDELNKWLFCCLINENQQLSIKILIQWMIVRIYCKLNKKQIGISEMINQSRKGTNFTCIFPILFHLVKEKDVEIDFVYDCMEFLLPHSMGQQFNIRFQAQVTMKHIYEIYKKELNYKYFSIYKTLVEVIDQTKSDKITDNKLFFYDLKPTIETIFYDLPRLTNVSETEWLPLSYFTEIFGFNLKSEDEIKNMKISMNNKNDLECNKFVNVQRKIDPLLNETTKIKSLGNLIVVASLINRIPNLGGLSRTCEIFGVKQYVLNNKQFIQNKDFQSLSKSSEKWVDVLEVKVENLSDYLMEMKMKNYRIVGAEQTSDSKKLDQFSFEKNTVLLLGNENEGIPPNLINLLDDCIEIPQIGQIRSLNVHVAGALFIWEYSKQHILK